MRYAVLAMLVLIAGCQGTTPTVQKPKATAAPAVVATPGATGVVYSGTALAPIGIVAQGAGNIISGNGSAIVAQGAGNRRVLAATEQPLAGAKVYLADASGQAVAGSPAGTTDASGHYRLTAPKDGRYVVVVQGANGAGKPVALQAIAFKAGEVVVNGASTCVTATVLDGKTGDVGQLDAAAFAGAVNVVASKLTDANHPDWSDRAAIAAFTNGIAELKDLLVGLGAKVDALNTKLDQLLNPSPTPVPTPTPFVIVPASDGSAHVTVKLTGVLNAKDGQPGKVQLLLRSVDSDEKSDNGLKYKLNKDSKPTALGTVGQPVTFELGVVTLPTKVFLQGVRGETLGSYDAIKAADPDEDQELKLDVHDGVIKLTLKDKTGQNFFLSDVKASASP